MLRLENTQPPQVAWANKVTQPPKATLAPNAARATGAFFK